MVRTQISLSERERELLDKAAKRTGKSMSALIRDALEIAYGESHSAAEDIARMRVGFGAWQDRDFDGAEYVDRLRTGRRLQEAYKR